MLTGEGAGGTSAEVTDLAGEKGTGEGVGGTGSVSIISSRTSTEKRRKIDANMLPFLFLKKRHRLLTPTRFLLFFLQTLHVNLSLS